MRRSPVKLWMFSTLIMTAVMRQGASKSWSGRVAPRRRPCTRALTGDDLRRHAPDGQLGDDLVVEDGAGDGDADDAADQLRERGGGRQRRAVQGRERGRRTWKNVTVAVAWGIELGVAWKLALEERSSERVSRCPLLTRKGSRPAELTVRREAGLAGPR